MTAGRRIVVVVLALLAVSTVAIAAVVHSAVPLFFAWLPQLGIIAYLSRADRPPTAAESDLPEGPRAGGTSEETADAG